MPGTDVDPSDAAEALRSRLLAQVAAHAADWSRDPRWQRLDARHLEPEPFQLADAPASTPESELIGFARDVVDVRGDTAPDDRPECRQPARWRLLREHVQLIGLELPAPVTCAALERFVDPRAVPVLEVWFVSPTNNSAAATFGHLVLRLVQGSGEPDAGAAEADATDTVYEISALTGFRHSLLDYLARGLSGGFPLVFEPVPMSVALRHTVGYEQRRVQRFRLNLTDDQRRRVLELLWQAERTLVLPYRFMTRNCATYLLWLLATALDGELRIDDSVWVGAPAEVIDRLAKVHMPHDGKPLLLHRPGSFDTSAARASRAADHATNSFRRLEAQLPAALGAKWQALDGLAPVELVELARATLAQAPGLGPDIEAILLARVLARRAEVDVAQSQANRIEEQRLLPIPGRPLPGIAEVLAWRKHLYAHEDPNWRQQRLAERIAWIDEYLQQAPRRATTSNENKVLAAAEAAGERFDAATESYAVFADLADAEVAPTSEKALEVEHLRQEMDLWQERVVRDGALTVDVGWQRDGNVQGPALRLAFWREELGQWRPHGVGPLTAFVLADVDTRFGLSGSDFRWLATHARVFELAVVTRQPPVGLRPLLRRVGWGLSVMLDVERYRLTGATRFDGYALWLDGVDTPWLAGLRLGVVPLAGAAAGSTGVDVAAVAETFLQRRIGATGRLGVTAEARRTWTDTSLASGIALDVPWGSSESWRTRIDVELRCRSGLPCGSVWGARVSF